MMVAASDRDHRGSGDAMGYGRLTLPVLAVVGLLSAGTAGAQGGDPPPNNLPNGYITVLNWAKFPDGRRWGSTAGIDVAPDGTIWAYDRCGANSCVDSDLDPILHFDTSGRLLDSFGAGLFNVPHGLHVDPDGNVWVTNHGVDPPNGAGQQVFKFTPRGETLMTLGRAGVAGVGQYTFNQPSDVLVAPSGEIFVADGHGPQTNARIVKFAPDGTFITSWAVTDPAQTSSRARTRSPWTHRAGCSSVIGPTIGSRSMTRTGYSSTPGPSSGDRAGSS